MPGMPNQEEMPPEQEPRPTPEWTERINRLMSGTIHEQVRGLADAVRDGFERFAAALEALGSQMTALQEGGPAPAAGPTPEVLAVRDEILAAREGVDEAVAEAQSQLGEQLRRGLQSVNNAVKAHLEAAAARDAERAVEIGRRHEALVEQVTRLSHALMDAVAHIRSDVVEPTEQAIERVAEEMRRHLDVSLTRLAGETAEKVASASEAATQEAAAAKAEVVVLREEVADAMADLHRSLSERVAGTMDAVKAEIVSAVEAVGAVDNDVDSVREDLAARAAEVRSDLVARTEEVRSDLVARTEEVRDELSAKIENLRGALAEVLEALPETVAMRVDANRLAVAEELEAVRAAVASDLGSVRNSLAVAVTGAKSELGEAVAAVVDEKVSAVVERLDAALKGLGADMEFLAQRVGAAGPSTDLRGELARVQDSVNAVSKRLEDRLEALRRLMLRTAPAE